MQSNGGGEIAGTIFGLLCFGLIALVVLAMIGFWLWMLIDCATNEPNEGSDKIIWIVVIVLVGWIGAVIYYFARRPQRMRLYGR